MSIGAHRIAIDVGGTFTDLVVSGADGSARTLKLLSTPDDYSRAIADGLARLFEDGAIDPAGVGSLVHAFTVATNALLTGKGAKVALITSQGFRDVLEIARLRMPQLYNMDWDKPRPLVPRRLRFEIEERMGADGVVVTPLNPASVIAALDKMRGQDVDSVAICLLHSYLNPAHERAVMDLVRQHAPGLSISASHQVMPEIREYERTSTTVVNAFVKPVVDTYLASVEEGIAGIGIRAPLMVMQSSGGIAKADIARAFPARCVESGPAAGAIGAAALGEILGEANIIAFDMGGTTAKACLIESGEPRLTDEMEVGAGINAGQRLLGGGGYLVRSPTIDLAEIGAGGGSLAWIDKGGALRVGPESAGAAPGPACYGLGGTRPTVTDANVVLGFLNPSHLLDGDMPISIEAAKAAIQEHVAGPLGMDIHEAAWGIHAVADAAMTRAIQAVSSEIGRSPGDFAMVAFGGNGAVHGATLAAHAGISEIIIPPASGVFSALGLLFARIQHRLVAVCWYDIDKADCDALNARAEKLFEEARGMMAGEGVAINRSELQFTLDLRYAGQSSELGIAVKESVLTPAVLAAAAKAFHVEHERTYGYSNPGERVQIVNLRLRARSLDRWDHVPSPSALKRKPSGVSVERPVYFGPQSGWVTAKVIRRQDLTGKPQLGPLIIEEYDTTIIVPPGAQVHATAGTVRIRLKGDA
ncbi:MAG: hydantoinase/oxoprolinase family protein [Alphaproteobacteria bacterium]